MCSSYIILCLFSWIHLLGTCFEEDINHLRPFCTFPCFVWQDVSLEGLTLSIIGGLTYFKLLVCGDVHLWMLHFIPFISCWWDISHWDHEVSWFYVLDEGRCPLIHHAFKIRISMGIWFPHRGCCRQRGGHAHKKWYQKKKATKT